jgi:hypothetical protein
MVSAVAAGSHHRHTLLPTTTNSDKLTAAPAGSGTTESAVIQICGEML